MGLTCFCNWMPLVKVIIFLWKSTHFWLLSDVGCKGQLFKNSSVKFWKFNFLNLLLNCYLATWLCHYVFRFSCWYFCLVDVRGIVELSLFVFSCQGTCQKETWTRFSSSFLEFKSNSSKWVFQSYFISCHPLMSKVTSCSYEITNYVLTFQGIKTCHGNI